MIPVAKPYSPPIEKYTKYIQGIYDREYFTNFGPLYKELTSRLEDYLGVKNLLIVSNGTLALQIAYKVLGVKNSALTTPFTFVATTSALSWEKIKPKFCDIQLTNYNIDPQKIESFIDDDTSAIVPVHVYGNPCDVHEIERIGRQKKLPVIYDAAHAFGIKVGNQSILNYGDASTLSFHATKVFHTVEGGGIVFKKQSDYDLAVQQINFGIDLRTNEISSEGINAKVSEFHSAMGLAVLDDIDLIIENRLDSLYYYNKGLKDYCKIAITDLSSNYNGAYAPFIFPDLATRTTVQSELKSMGISSRPYFSPSINRIPTYGSDAILNYPNSERMADTILCLPLYFGIDRSIQDKVINCIKKNI